MTTVLLIDAGNSAVKWALADEQVLNNAHRLSYDLAGLKPLDLQPLLESQRCDCVVGCIVASDAIYAAIEREAALAGKPVTWLEAQPAFDDGRVRLTNGYRNPEQLGADRWHALLGARTHHPETALVVVQMGTATTIDGVTTQGHFVGGEILPGVALMHASLARGTARLNVVQGEPNPFADNTADAIASGVHDAQWGAVQRYWRRFVARYAPEGGAQLVLTGGGAAQLAAVITDPQTEPGWASEVQHNLVPDLVLRGLWLRWKHSLGT